MIRSLIHGVLDDYQYNIAIYMLNKYVVNDTDVSPGLTQGKAVTFRKGKMTKRLRGWMQDKNCTPRDSLLKARIFAGYRIASGALVTAAGFQRSTEVSSENRYIAYYWSDAVTKQFSSKWNLVYRKAEFL